MRKIGSEVAAGVAIFLAFILFVFGFLFLKNTMSKAGTYNVYAKFTDITGLERHDKVSVSGLIIGKVQNFKFEGLNVIVEIQLNPEAVLPQDSYAELKSLGMVGEKTINIIPGKSTTLLKDGDGIAGRTARDITDMTGTIEGLMQRGEELITKVSDAFENVFDPATQTNIKESLEHANNLSAVLAKNSAQIEASLKNLAETSNSLNQILTERKAKIESTIDNVYSATNQFEKLTTKFDQSLTSIQSLLDKIENQEGTVGKVIMSDSLYNNVQLLTTELNLLVQDLKKRPQKYINLGFIKVF